MVIEIITREDLVWFKKELVSEFQKIVNEKQVERPLWIKSSEVRQLLQVSPGTLQNLRTNGTLPYTKIGGVMYYTFADIEKVMESRKVRYK